MKTHPRNTRPSKRTLRMCRECATEVSGFHDVRRRLSEWQTPEIDLGYRVVRDPVTEPRRWWQASLPVWAQAAAAVLVLSAGAGLANLQIEYGATGVQLRTDGHAQAHHHRHPA